MPRDISGVYTLPLGNPVIPGTVIDTAWANPTMSDIATQLNNVITRDGLLGYTAPAKFIDGSQLLPAMAFASEGGLGLYRKILNTLAVVSNNQEVALFKDTQINFQKPVALASTLAVTGAATFAGAVTFSGSITSSLSLPDGSAAAPALFFTSDVDTGIYSPGVGNIGFSTGGVARLAIDSNGTTTLVAPSVSTNTFGVQTGPSTIAIDVLGISSGAETSAIRFRDSTGANTFAQITGDNTGISVDATGARTLSLGTNGVIRLTFTAAGLATFSGDVGIGGVPTFPLDINGPAANIALRPSSTTNNALVRMVNGGGNAYMGLDNSSGGLSGVAYSLNLHHAAALPIIFATAGAQRMMVGSTGNVGIGPGTPGQLFEVQGVSGSKINLVNTSDSNRGGFLSATTSVGFMVASNSGVYPLLLGVDSTEGARITTGTPRLIVGGSSLPGTGTYNGLLGVTTSNSSNCAVEVHSVGANNLRMVMFANSNNGLMGWDMSYSAGFLGYVWDVVGSEKMRLTVGGELGINCAPPSTVSLRVQQSGANDVGLEWQRLNATTGSLLSYNRSGSAYTNLTLDALSHVLNISGTTKLTVDSSGNTTIYGRTFVRQGIASTDFDPAVGPTGNNTSTNCPIGSIVMANVAGIVVNAFATNNAATNNLTVHATNGGTNSTISTGTWRCLGARDTATGFALWIRTA